MASEEERTKKQYELRLNIEADMYALWETGFSIDDLQDFVSGVVDDITEEATEEEA